MPYTTRLLYDVSAASSTPDAPTRRLDAETDDGALVEADRCLRAARVVAGVRGGRVPAAGVLSKDDQEFACIVLRHASDR